jgi:hypothetical protein
MSNGLHHGISGVNNVGVGQDTRFPDPFCDIASMQMPTTIASALSWSEFLLEANGTYREALRRIVSYFITDVEIIDDGDKKVGKAERDQYLTFLNDVLGIKNVLHTVAMDYLCYGNSFTSVMMPFRRYLACKKCGLELPLRKVVNTPQFKFAWQDYDFRASCPHCKYTGQWRHIDRRSGESGDVKVKRWSPHEIDLLWDPLTEDVTHIWKIPDEYRTQLQKGHLHHIERASWEVLQAVKSNQNLMFDKDVVYHMKEETLAGIKNRGWGFSRVLTNFRQAYYVQILQRYNEAIALDYVIPFRVLTPESRPGGGGPESSDPVHSINLSGFVGRVQSMIAQRAKDPARWNVLPFALDYKALGGDATQLAPKELLDQGIDQLLTSIGMPIDFFKGTLNTQSSPTTLRLMEANWSHLVHKLNVFINKLVKRISTLLGWDPVNARLVRVTVADDLNRQMAKLQLMMGNQISKTTGLSSVGLDYDGEVRRMLEEARIEADEQQRAQKELEQAAQMQEYINAIAPDITTQAMASLQGGAQGGGAGAPPGTPGAPGQGPSAVDQFIAQRQNNPNVPITPDELQAQAQTIAQDLMAKDPTARRTELAKLRKSDTTMHQLVTSLMDQMRDQAASQGRQAVLDQQFGGSGGGGGAAPAGAPPAPAAPPGPAPAAPPGVQMPPPQAASPKVASLLTPGRIPPPPPGSYRAQRPIMLD